VLSPRAEQLGQISAAARCEELIGRARGMFVDRGESKLSWDGDINKLSTEQMQKLLDSLQATARQDDSAGLDDGPCGELPAAKEERVQ
jgi:hypothetical protein